MLEGLSGTEETPTEAIATLASVYNTGNAVLSNLTITNGLNVTGPITGNGGANLNNTAFSGAIVMKDNPVYLRDWNDGNNGIMYNNAIDGPEVRGYAGGVFTTNSGGNKQIITYNQSGATVNGTLSVNGVNILSAIQDLQNNAIRKDKAYAIQSQGSGRGGFLPDNGGWVSNAGDAAARMMFVQL
jgi:hypothetical protein